MKMTKGSCIFLSFLLFSQDDFTVFLWVFLRRGTTLANLWMMMVLRCWSQLAISLLLVVLYGVILYIHIACRFLTIARQ